MWVQGSGVALTPSSLSSHTCPALRGCDKKEGKHRIAAGPSGASAASRF